jgi:CubicO group peptidase (beta-lactamase class C family)
MSSGLRFDMIADNVTLPLADDMTALALSAPVTAPPGSRWEYNNHSVQAMEPVLRAATGMAADDYADAHLFGPLGMNVDWKRDARGQPALYMNAKASCRDNARLAYLMMQGGCWEGERILSSEFVADAVGPSTAHNRGYGLWWWKNGDAPTLDSVTFEDKGHMLHPYAPDDAFCAVGLGSQFVEAIPSLDLVVVRLGTAPHDDLTSWLDPLALYEAISTDGEQYVHNGILERVLDAVVE